MPSKDLDSKYTVKKMSSKCSEIIHSNFSNVMTLITFVCHSTTSRFIGVERPEHKECTCRPKPFKESMERLIAKDYPKKTYTSRKLEAKTLETLAITLFQYRSLEENLVVLENVPDKILGINFIR
jgi:hypothetical protein